MKLAELIVFVSSSLDGSFVFGGLDFGGRGGRSFGFEVGVESSAVGVLLDLVDRQGFQVFDLRFSIEDLSDVFVLF